MVKLATAPDLAALENSSQVCGRWVVRVSFAAAFFLLFAVPPQAIKAQQDVESELRTASTFHEQADYAHSIPLLQHIVRQAPKSYAANLLLGEDLFKTGSFKNALHPLEAASALPPQDGVADVYLAQTADALNNYPRAAGALLTALNRSHASTPVVEAWASYCLDRVQTIGPHLRDTKDGEAVALRIESALRPEGTEVREKLLEQSAAEDPKQRGIWGELGTSQLELGQQVHAAESLQNAQQREPDENATLQLEGLLAAVSGDWHTAEERLTALAARSPAEFHNALGIWLHLLAPKQQNGPAGWPCLNDPAHACPASLARPQGGEGLTAHELYTEGRWEQLAAVPASSEDGDLQKLWRGVAFAETGHCLDAIPLLEDGTKSDERAAGFWLDICYANQGNAALARLRKDGDKVAVEQLEGDIQMHLHDDAAAAETHYAEALKADPRNAHLLERSAEAELKLGNTDEGKRLALAALALEPHNAYAIKALATVAIEERDYKDALARLRQLAALEPQDPWTRVELGVSYAQLGDAARAVPYLQQELLAGYPDEKGGLHATLAKSLRRLGREEEAKKADAQSVSLANASLEGSGRPGAKAGTTNAPQ